MKMLPFVLGMTASTFVPAYTHAAPATMAAAPAPESVPAAGGQSGCVAGAFAAPGVVIELVRVISGSAPGWICHVEGSVATSGEGAPSGAAGFALDLPSNWNGRMVFDGGGGLDGFLPEPRPEYLARGYAALGTDAGHRSANPFYDTSWLRLSSGAPNEGAIADYLHRAIPQVNQAIRPLIARYYASVVRHAYFMGCSNGGREALFQASAHPDAFDGYIAGAPSVVPALGMPEVWKLKLLADAPISYSTLQAVDKAVLADCDMADGVSDGLIQNPGACRFDPRKLVAGGILSARQAEAVRRYLSAIRDDQGEFIEPGSVLSGIGAVEHYPGFSGSISGAGSYEADPASDKPNDPSLQKLAAEGLISTLVFNDPGLDLGGPALFAPNGALRHEAVEKTRQRWAGALATPATMNGVFAHDRKVLIYHGLSDHDTSAWETQRFYLAVARRHGGLAATRRTMALFLVPGMGHCQGGDGPNMFDPLAAMERWVDSGQSPKSMLAVKYGDDRPEHGVVRSMPLCPFPAKARYDGHGRVMDGRNWHCPAGDQAMLTSGRVGQLAEAR